MQKCVDKVYLGKNILKKEGKIKTKKILKFLAGFPLQIFMLWVMFRIKMIIINDFDLDDSIFLIIGVSFIYGALYIVMYDRIKFDSMGIEKIKSYGELTEEELESKLTKFIYYLNKKYGKLATIFIIGLVDPSACALFGRSGSFKYKKSLLMFVILLYSCFSANLAWFAWKGYFG